MFLMIAILFSSLMAFADVCLDIFADSVSGMSTTNNTVFDVGSTLLFPAAYSFHEYLCTFLPRLDAGRFEILPTGSMLTVIFGHTEHETAYTGKGRCWKHWNGQRLEDDYTHENVKDMPFVRSVEDCPTREDLLI